jgi:ADP-ribose pyrophosphatase
VAKRTKAEVLKSDLVYQGPVFGVQRDLVREPGGVEATRDVVTHSGSIAVLPVFPDGRVLLIRQYRHAAQQFLWEIVAGRKDPGENFQHAAHRELVEETGYRARRLRQVLDVYPTPGFVQERLVIFVATGLTAGAAQPEADERITWRLLPLRQAVRWVHTNKIHDAKSVCALLYCAQFLGTKSDTRTKKR